MMEFASWPPIRLPPTTLQPPHVGSSTLPLPHSIPSGSFGNLSDFSMRPSDARTQATNLQNRTIPPIAHVKDGIRGLQAPHTPPPEMTTTDSRPCSYNSNSSHGYLKPFDHPIASSDVSWTLRDSAQPKQTYQQRSPSKHVSVYNAQSQQEPPQPKRRRSSTVRTGAAMTVPASINSSRGNLAEFAAQITCLFWFESASLLHTIAESTAPSSPSPLQPLARHAVPQIEFLKWVTTVLSTTQVSQNVVLLALLFVHRLKKLNPTVQGKPGSQYRLFTVALMLGNKYLDDNTYTNKTWAEVSGIHVQEIHIMEVEFLSNMRYSLYVGDQEWKDWHTKLGRYWTYWDTASKLPLAPTPPTTSSRIPPPLPSPPYSNSASPPFTTSHTPPIPSSHSLFLPAPLALDPPHNPSVPMPQPDFDLFSRKRSFDYTNAMQPPNKRVTRSSVPKLSVSVPQFPVSIPSTAPLGNVPPRLQPLEYSVQSSQPPSRPSTTAMDNLLVSHSQQPMHPQLPLPCTRSMPLVHSHSPLGSSPATSGPPTHFNFSPYNTRQTSPYSAHHSVASSPITPIYSSQRSPTWILGNRESPYRPVRGVNTLLVPPPHPHHLDAPQQITYDQMHYQPLAKAKTEYKTGVVPYMQPEVSWSHSSWSDNHFFG